MTKQSIIVILVLILIVAGIYLGFLRQEATLKNGNDDISNGGTKIINVDASRWEYSPETITVKKGEYVTIVINSKDTSHGISIPDFGVSGVESVEFIADKVGNFEFKCPTFCGEGHKDMKGTIIVEE